MANQQSLNVVKSEYLIIGSKPKIDKLTSDPNICIGAFQRKRVVKTKLPGVTLDENLSWCEQIDYKSKKALNGSWNTQTYS